MKLLNFSVIICGAGGPDDHRLYLTYQLHCTGGTGSALERMERGVSQRHTIVPSRSF